MVVMLIRLLFVSPVASLTVIYPLTIAFANSVGLDPLLTYLSTTIIICSVMTLPIDSPILVLANETGHLYRSWGIPPVRVGRCRASEKHKRIEIVLTGC